MNDHVIHSRGGRIGGRADSTCTDVDRIVGAIFSDPRSHLIVHFHGGLVSKEAGLEIAKKLMPVYSPAANQGGYPLFFVWESSAWETIRNNLTELAGEPVFKQLLRKLLQYTLEHLGGVEVSDSGAKRRSIAPGSTGSKEKEVRDALEEFWAHPSKETLPFRDMEALVDPDQARSIGGRIDEEEIRADLENDSEFVQALATLPDLPEGTRSTLSRGASAPPVHRSAFSELASTEFSASAKTRGWVTMLKVASFVITVLRAILKRRAARRDHGFHATCVEEIVRAFKVGGSRAHEWGKALQWNRMKQDTEDAFGPDFDVHAGTALLARLGQATKERGRPLERLTLVGHSTGAIYIAHWLEHARKHLPDVRHDVVFLAPAITYEFFARTVRRHDARIAAFRMFAMQDELERDDQVWGSDQELPEHKDWRRYLYPSSLLYLVSGILENSVDAEGKEFDEADVPLLGLHRHWLDADTYTRGANPSFEPIDAVRAWLKNKNGGLVWSKSLGGDGLDCESFDHGAFDNDKATLNSLSWIATNGI